MKNIFSSPLHFPSRARGPRLAAAPTPTATDLAEYIHFSHPESVEELRAMARHPRSLARPLATWRPPVKDLPVLEWADDSGPVRLTLTRYRVGPRARARVRGYGETREPAYLLSARITSPRGESLPPAVAEAWVRALVDAAHADAVHEITTSSAATFVWLVDRDFTPVRSPMSLFEDFAAAA